MKSFTEIQLAKILAGASRESHKPEACQTVAGGRSVSEDLRLAGFVDASRRDAKASAVRGLLAPLQGASRFERGVRWYRFAQPPATVWQSSGLLPVTIATLLFASLLAAIPVQAQLSTNMQSWMRRLNSGEFTGGGGGRGGGGGGARGGRGGGSGQWIDGGRAYTRVERGAIVRYDTATGSSSTVMSAEQMTPPKLGRALQPIDSESSTNARQLLFSTNPRPTMIRKTAYDYWVLDKTDGSWHKLGGKTNSGLLYAKLSPDGSRAAYVRDNDLYVETIHNGAIKRLTSDGSGNIINGTSDWVNEEEFYLRDAFEWSPDSRSIAYLQFDQSNVPEFALINYTDTLYPVITKYHYPKPGQTNSAVRVGVVSASGGSTRWINVPGNPRDIYIPRIGWADAQHVILQQMNRLQHTNNIWLAEAKTGRPRLMFQDRDDAWIEREQHDQQHLCLDRISY